MEAQGVRSAYINDVPMTCRVRPCPATRRAIAELSVYALCSVAQKLGHDRTLVAAMQQIADWLKKLGMSEYAERFAENDIDMAVLSDLTDQHLKDLGVSLGHRLKMLRAIRDLGGDSIAVAAPSAPVATEPTRRDEAERRQLTVMFCDLVGSTALSARLDPEDLRSVIGAYHKCVAETVGRFDGFVAKYMGDGVLVYFGYPQAHEEDGERAVHAALAVIDAIGRLDLSERLQVRLGVASGLVVVGDLIGEGAAQERGVVGETPNLAARLQDLAPPDSVVIAESTRRLLGDLFEYRDLGLVVVKGFGRPVSAWQVLQESAVVSRFEALRGETLTPFIGREEEIDLLLRRWRRAMVGEGQVVMLGGEAGIGKSRLVGALRERLGSEGHARLRYFCSPHHQDSALHPFIAQLERAAGFAREDAAATKLDKLEALFAAATPPLEDLALVADLLSLPAEPRYPPLGLTPQARKEKTFAALLRQLEALARRQPVLVIFEDLHWIDPSSRELLDRTIDRAASLPVFIVATHRAEFMPPWVGLPQVTTITLNRFDRRAGAALVGGIAGATALAADVAAEIVERADGVPLFVEELTKAVVEAGGSGSGIENTLGALASTSAVPPALHASLMARLDRLGPGPKEVAQIAAVIGREFSYQLLAPIAARGDNDLGAALGRLGDAALVFARGAPPASTYLFKHALVRDAAYASLLRRRREELHAQIVAALESEFPETVEAQPELLAQHLTEAGLVERAVAWWQRAGERATGRSANIEAIAHLNRGLKVLQRLPESRQRDEFELSVQLALVAPHWASKGFASPEAGHVARRAVDLARRLGSDTPDECQALWACALFYMVSGQTRTGVELGARWLELAERIRDPSLLGYARWFMGNCLLWLGDLPMARAHLEHGIAEYDLEWAQADTARHGYDPGVACRSFLSRVLWHLGFPIQGLAYAEDAIAGARAARQPFNIVWALSWGAALHQLCGDVVRTEQVASEDLALATEQVLPFFGAHAMVLGGWAAVRQGQGETGLEKIREGIDAFRATGSAIELSHWLGLLAEACRDTERPEEGLRVVGEALEHVNETGIVYYEPELHRLEGELRLRCDTRDVTAAESSFRRAIAIASKQGAKSWELRATTSLARLWRDQGKRQQAHDLLAPVYGWFTEGFDTLDLKEAKMLLGQLV
jgi:class 3 adenylate cyclase/predicted ATPase